MDPLTELKGLLNIPEGMTAAEAETSYLDAVREVSRFLTMNRQFYEWASLKDVRYAITLVLNREAENAPSA